MYVNQIDNIIDKILDELYLDFLIKDDTFNILISGKKINYVEYRDKINESIDKFVDSVDLSQIEKIINNNENLEKIIDIIKRYVAYYYFLSIAYYYTGNIKNYRNNLIQYSKLQENSVLSIKKFFDTENNSQLIKYYKIIKDASNIMTMTELQKKTLNAQTVKDAVDFLNNLGREYIDNYLLMLITENNNETVVINVHNLIKTIVFGEIYQNQEQQFVFEILNDVEENNYEYTYIDIVVANEESTDYDSFRQIFLGDDNNETLAKDAYELLNNANRVPYVQTTESKIGDLVQYNFVSPIVDDFLRYHRDTERLDADNDKNLPLVNMNNGKNIQAAILYQQRKKKENTRAQLVVNKIDAISDLYSENVKNNTDVLKEIQKNFQNPLSYRKAVLHNYLDEVHVLNKIRNQGRRAIEGNEYYLELVEIINNAYFNFKNFKKYGTNVSVNVEKPVNVVRYNNIEWITTIPNAELETHTIISDKDFNLVGLTLNIFYNKPIQCIQKKSMIDIRTVTLNYHDKQNKITSRNVSNGYKAFIKMFKTFFIDTIKIRFNPKLEIYNDFDDIKNLNPSLIGKMIYWVYDVELDIFEMDTYENLKSTNFQETIRYLNSLVYDKLSKALTRKCTSLIKENPDYTYFQIEQIVELYSNIHFLTLNQSDKKEMIIQDYLHNKNEKESLIKPIDYKIEMPNFVLIPDMSTFKIRIDTLNPTHPREYISLESYANNESNRKLQPQSKCQHEIEWNDMQKLKSKGLNSYNEAAGQFIEKFAIETLELDFVCRICGQLLPLKQYVQDGSYDNNTQKFVTSYLPLDIPLEEIKEYQKYNIIIKALDILINRVSFITGTNMLVGPNSQIQQKRKAIVKNIIDLIVLHNAINLSKKENDDERLEYFEKKFNINKDLDSVIFFELDDKIFNFKQPVSTVNADVNKLKYNNILLYLMLIFMTELNGSQIAMIHHDKFANIYVFLKYGPKLFDNLLIKKNINDMETVPITNYPIFCYLIFVLSYFLIRNKLWSYEAGDNAKSFNPFIQRIIINSIVDLFNSISMDAGKNTNDYVYTLTTSKLYTQMNGTFKNNRIIDLLKTIHLQYSDNKNGYTPVKDNKDAEITYSISDPIKIERKQIKLHSYKIGDGLSFNEPSKVVYPITKQITNLTNCDSGAYYEWHTSGKEIVDINCNDDFGNTENVLNRAAGSYRKDLDAIIEREKDDGTLITGEDANGTIDRTTELYYYNLNVIANRRCLEGTLHDFIAKNGQLVCTICGRTANVQYTVEELNKLASNLHKLENEKANELIENIALRKEDNKKDEEYAMNIIQSIQKDYNNENNNRIYGNAAIQIDKLMIMLEEYIGQDTNLDVDKFPVYLNDDVYIIDHIYDGTPLDNAILFKQKNDRIHFREDHPYYKTDVYYYTDNQNQIDVYYHAVSLKLLGYKEKHRDYVTVNKGDAYLKISTSIKNRLLTIGYETKYINIADMFNKNSKYIKDVEQNFHRILNNLIKDHSIKIKSVIDKISAIIYKIKNYQPEQNDEDATIIPLQTTLSMENITNKYSKMLKNFKIGEANTAFNSWNELRNSYEYTRINWNETNIKLSTTMYVNSETISYYDVQSNIMIYYLINELITIIESNPERNTKINIIQMYVEIITYIYSIYNIDPYKNSIELKRFEYILNGSDVMIDVLKKGQGLLQSKEVEENLDDDRPDLMDTAEADDGENDEIEDLREEAEAIDIEGDYYAEEDEDTAQGNDYEE